MTASEKTAASRRSRALRMQGDPVDDAPFTIRYGGDGVPGHAVRPVYAAGFFFSWWRTSASTTRVAHTHTHARVYNRNVCVVLTRGKNIRARTHTHTHEYKHTLTHGTTRHRYVSYNASGDTRCVCA